MPSDTEMERVYQAVKSLRDRADATLSLPAPDREGKYGQLKGDLTQLLREVKALHGRVADRRGSTPSGHRWERFFSDAESRLGKALAMCRAPTNARGQSVVDSLSQVSWDLADLVKWYEDGIYRENTTRPE